VRIYQIAGVLLALMLVSCAKHDVTPSAFEPVSTFSGRLLVMDPKHRFQVELDWQANETKGTLRLTHALSGRMVFVQWQGKKMFWHDNNSDLSWSLLSEEELKDMGVIFPPWTLAKVFLGQYPSSMQSQNKQLWKGTWDEKNLQIKWSNNYRRVELTDFKRGQKAIVIMNE